MRNLWFTADTHFGHENIIKYCNRPYHDVSEMDNDLIERWNSCVGDDDIVYHLGDFTLGRLDVFQKYCSQLVGNIYVVPGGHDCRWMNDAEAQIGQTIGTTQTGWVILKPTLMSIDFHNDNERYSKSLILCHYAMRVWDKSHYGSVHLYGHSHGNLPSIGRSMDVGVDCHNFYPVDLNDVWKLFDKEMK